MGRAMEQDSGPRPGGWRSPELGANDVLLLIYFARRDGEKAVKREVSCLHTPGNQGRSINAT